MRGQRLAVRRRPHLHSHSRPHSHSAGFTLVEILLAMVLLSVVMLALGTALRTMALAEQRVDQRLVRSDEFRVATSFIRSSLERVSARRVTPPPPSASAVLFVAAPDAVSWVGIMPARYGAGGRYFFHLGAEPAGASHALVLRFQPWSDAASFPDWSQAESRTLVDDLVSVAIQYEDARAAPSVWTSVWPHTDRLPQRLLLDVQTLAGPWPSLVAPLRVLPAEGGRGQAVVGGGS